MLWIALAIGPSGLLADRQTVAPGRPPRVVRGYYAAVCSLGRDGVGLVAALALAVQQARAAQERGKVLLLAVEFEHLRVQFRHEGGRRDPFARRDLVEDAPEGVLQTDARALAVEPHAAGFEAVAIRVLPGE